MNGDKMNKQFWLGKRVFVTGHTGFKGAWLCLWLHLLGAEVTGYALQPPTNPSLFQQAQVEELITSVTGNICDLNFLTSAMKSARPEFIIHMAAQPLVRESYKIPVDTFQTNVMGTVHMLEAVRKCDTVRAVVNITTDKCYDNRELQRGYQETDSLGGFDPYSSSKACSELVTAAYRSSYFHPARYEEHGVAVATARAGNVIGGGDWAADRLVPDIFRAITANEAVIIRNPQAIRPWQHVLEPLSGYLLLAQHLYEDGANFSESWNFGPEDGDVKPVEWIVQRLCDRWGSGAGYAIDHADHPHETNYLKLDCAKANNLLGWYPKWGLEHTLDMILAWVQAWKSGTDVRTICLQQINDYMKS